MLSELNPVLLSIYYKSASCLTFLVENFGIKKSMGNKRLFAKVNGKDFEFKTILGALLLTMKDHESLQFLLKQQDFSLEQSDLTSLIGGSMKAKWI